jgi:hypothetical protein
LTLIIIGVVFQKTAGLFFIQLLVGGLLLLLLRIINLKELKMMFLPSKETKNNI